MIPTIRWNPWSGRWVGGVIFAGCALALAGGCAPGDEGAPALVAGRMALLPFADPDGNAELAQAVEGAVSSAAAGVDGAEVVRVADSEGVSPGDPLGKIASETGAGMILRGTVARVGDQVELTAEIVDPLDASRKHVLPPEHGPASDPSAAVDRLASRVAGALAMHLDPESTAPWYYTVPTLEAYRVTKQGDSLFAQYKQEESLPYFYRAYAADTMNLNPLFAATAVHRNMGRPAVGDSLLAVIEVRADRLTELERFNIPWYRGTPEEALAAAKGAAALDPLGWTYAVGLRANWAGHFAEAVEWLGHRQELVDRGSYWARTWTPFRSQYMMALHAVGDHETELAEAQLARADFSDDPWWIWNEMMARAGMGQADIVRAQFDTTVMLQETHEDSGYWEALEDIATELMVHGQPDLGHELQERVVAHYREVGNTTQLADALGFAGRPQEAYDVLVTIVDGATTPDQIGWFGAAAAIVGDAQAAEEALARLEDHVSASTGNNLRYQAAIHGALGRCERAMELYHEATQAGFAYHQAWGGEWWHRDWETVPVRTNCPEFQTLLDLG